MSGVLKLYEPEARPYVYHFPHNKRSISCLLSKKCFVRTALQTRPHMLVAAAGRAGKFVFIRGRFFAPKRIESCPDRSPDIALLQDPAHVAFDDIPCAVRFQGYCAFVQGQVWLSAALPESGRYFR